MMSSWLYKVNIPANCKIRFAYCGEPTVSGQAHAEALAKMENKRQEALAQQQQAYEQQIQQLADKLDQAYDNYVVDFQQQLPGFLLKLLNLVIPKVKIDVENLTELIRPLLERISDEESLILHISPQNEPFLQDLKAHFHSKHKITWMVDEALKNGDIVLETSTGTLDNRLQSRIRTLKGHWSHYSA